MEEKHSEKDNKKKNLTIIIIAIIILLLVILFFIFGRPKYEITFDSNGGSQIESVKVVKNKKIEEPVDPIKEGYIFAGWYYQGELYDFDTPVTQDMTLEAQWALQGNAEISGIQLNQTNLTLAPDGIATLVATLFPEDAKQIKLIWTSSDDNIATVDENGNIKALKEGEVEITVETEDGKYKASCTVTIAEEKEEEEVEEETEKVNPSTSSSSNKNNNSNTKPNKPNTQTKPGNSKPSTVKPTGVKISGPTTVEVGSTIKLTATVTPANATNKSVKWSSSNSQIATVDANGKVTGKKAGKVTITVKTSNGKTDTHTVTVKAKNVPQPQKDTYSIVFTRVRQEGTNNVMQYTFVVYKNGKTFTDYLGFECGSYLTRKGNPYASLKSEDKTASLTLGDGTVVTATVTYKG